MRAYVGGSLLATASASRVWRFCFLIQASCFAHERRAAACCLQGTYQPHGQPQHAQPGAHDLCQALRRRLARLPNLPGPSMPAHVRVLCPRPRLLWHATRAAWAVLAVAQSVARVHGRLLLRALHPAGGRGGGAGRSKGREALKGKGEAKRWQVGGWNGSSYHWLRSHK